ncbi:MAG TPA: stage II sporulation protein M [Nitrososphaeraceae archaeon]
MHLTIKRRLLYLVFGIITFLISYYGGSSIHMSSSEVNELKNRFMDQIEDIDQIGIFINNAKIALGMFVPLLGVGVGIFSGFSTGMVFNAIAATSANLNDISPLLILITPFGLMEIIAYGLAISRSGMLFYSLLKRKYWREYLLSTLVEIGVVVILLLSGAIIEWEMITRLNGLSDTRFSI